MKRIVSYIGIGMFSAAVGGVLTFAVMVGMAREVERVEQEYGQFCRDYPNHQRCE